MENTRIENKQQQEQRIAKILKNHLQHEATPDTTTNFAHRMAMMASSGISGIKKLGQQLSSSSEEPVASSSSLLFGDPRGKQDWYTMAPMPLKQGDPNMVFTPQTTRKPTLIQIDNAVEKSKPQQKTKRNDYENEFQDMMADVESNPNYKAKPKAKTKAKPMTKEEEDLLDVIMKNAKTQPKSKPASSSSKPASSSSKPATNQQQPATNQQQPVKKSHLKSTTTTGILIPPAKIGIQKLREEFENAKNKKHLALQMYQAT